MDTFQVIVTPDAEADLKEIRDYISDVLLAPQAARSYLHFMREQIGKLEFLGASIAPVVDEPWHSKGVRRIVAKNFLIYFRVDTTDKTVYVLNVIYGKRDQLAALKRMDLYEN